MIAWLVVVFLMQSTLIRAMSTTNTRSKLGMSEIFVFIVSFLSLSHQEHVPSIIVVQFFTGFATKTSGFTTILL